MDAYVAVTDESWYRYLRDRPHLDEVNFWQPSGGRAFRALSPGEPLLFKLHAPNNAIVGGGFFAHFTRLPYRTAWDFFGPSNGAPGLPEMRRQIERYRRTGPSLQEDYVIGCIILAQPFFFHETEWIDVPPDFAPNIVQGKTYDLSTPIGAKLWREVQLRLQGSEIAEETQIELPMFGEERLVKPRLGQGAFRSLVTDTYQRRCAVTAEKALPVLEAAHILPVSEGGRHDLPNGLLLRSDIHRLFDRGYVTVTPDHRFRVSRRLKDDFDNGEPYFPLDRQEIWLPPRSEERPKREFLEWHADAVFRG